MVTTRDADPIATLQQVIDGLLLGREQLKVLDAGCGSRLPISLGPNAYVVGIDVSEAQLQRNDFVQEKIRGDIQTHELPPDLDVIVCWDVLEHLPKPEHALENFFRSISDGGIIILKSPNRYSLKGLITLVTPLRFHVWYYRRVLGRTHKGRDDWGPFPTYLKRSMTPQGVREAAERHGFEVVFLDLFENRQQRALRRRFHVSGWPWRMLKALVRLASFGKLSLDRTDYSMVLRKGKVSSPRPEPRPAPSTDSTG